MWGSSRPRTGTPLSMKSMFYSVVMFLAVSLSFLPALYAEPAQAAIQSVTGEVSVLRNSEGVIAAPGTLLDARDRILTGPDSEADIAGDDGWQFRLHEKSDCFLDRMESSQKEIRLESGEILLKSTGFPDEGLLRIRTPVAVANAQGAVLWGQTASGQGDTTFVVGEGRVEVMVLREGTRLVLAGGEAVQIFADGRETLLRPAFGVERERLAGVETIRD